MLLLQGTTYWLSQLLAPSLWFQGDVPEKYVGRDPGGDLEHCVAVTDLFLHANLEIDHTGSAASPL